MTLWAAMALGGLVTFALRLSFIAAEGKVALPDALRAMLPYVPIATLTAIVAPEVARPGGAWGVSLHNPRLVAAAAAVVVAAATRNVLVTLLAGFAVLLLVS